MKYFPLHQKYLTHCGNCISVGLPGMFWIKMTVFRWCAVSNCREYFAERAHNGPCLRIIVPGYLRHLRLLWLVWWQCHPGTPGADIGTCWQWEGVTSRLIGPDHYLLSNTNSWDFTQSLRSHRPLPPRLEGPSSVLWWEDTPETVSKVRAGRRGGRSITSVGGEQRLATSGLSECKTLTKYFVSSAGRRQGQDRSHPPSKDSFYFIFYFKNIFLIITSQLVADEEDAVL